MSYKPIECPMCHAQLRSKYDVRDENGSITRWKWLKWCPVCGTRLKVVFDDPWRSVVGVEKVDE